MPAAPEHPVTLGDLRVASPRDYRGNEDRNQYRSATVADLVSALRAEGVLEPINLAEYLKEFLIYRGDGAVLKVTWEMPDALAEAQPFPPAGG